MLGPLPKVGTCESHGDYWGGKQKLDPDDQPDLGRPAWTNLLNPAPQSLRLVKVVSPDGAWVGETSPCSNERRDDLQSNGALLPLRP